MHTEILLTAVSAVFILNLLPETVKVGAVRCVVLGVIFGTTYRPGVIFRRVHGPGVIFRYSPTLGVIFSQKATLCDNF
jgi:hypothetical protein